MDFPRRANPPCKATFSGTWERDWAQTAQAGFTSSMGWNGTDNPDWVIFPVVAVGGGVSVTGINTISGLTGSSVTAAENLLRDLSGSVGNVSLTFNVHSPTDQNFTAPVRIK